MNDEAAAVEAKIAEAVVRWQMLPRGVTVVAGLSGGADSVTLTHWLCRHAGEYGIRVLAAHVNHGLRGEEADADEQFVRDFCGRMGIPLEVLHENVAALAREKAMGIEECGREVRYSFFRRLCGPQGKIATAHTLSDSAETVLMNLAKGAGAKGLCGIPPVRGNIVRPLVGITRDEVEHYCAFYGLKFVTDSTNLEEMCARNRLRLRAVPVFREINPEFERAVGRTSEILRCDEEYFSRLAKDCLRDAALPGGKYRLDVLRAVPRAVLLRVIPAAAAGVKASRLGYEQISAVEHIIREGSGAVTVAGGIRCAACGSTLSVGIPSGRSLQDDWSLPLVPGGTVLPDGRTLELRPVPPDILKSCGKKINNLLFNNLINYDTIINTGGLVRNRRAGDKYRPVGRGVTKTLKKLFNEAKIPAEKRRSAAVLECGGKIVWVEGFGVSQEARATADTRSIAEIVIKECRQNSAYHE